MDQLLAKAVTIALEAHKDATDKAGMPYAGHIMRVRISYTYRRCAAMRDENQ